MLQGTRTNKEGDVYTGAFEHNEYHGHVRCPMFGACCLPTHPTVKHVKHARAASAQTGCRRGRGAPACHPHGLCANRCYTATPAAPATARVSCVRAGRTLAQTHAGNAVAYATVAPAAAAAQANQAWEPTSRDSSTCVCSQPCARATLIRPHVHCAMLRGCTGLMVL